jgi:hypothetical protein
MGALGVLFINSIKNGQIDKVLAPYDMNKHFCGFDGYYLYPKLYLTKVTGSTKDIFNSGICVIDCPKKGEKIIYMDGTEKTWPDVAEYDTISISNYCFFNFNSLPIDKQIYWSAKIQDLFSSPSTAWIYDLYLSSRAIYFSMAMSLVFSILYIYILSAYAEYIAWFLIAVV